MSRYSKATFTQIKTVPLLILVSVFLLPAWCIAADDRDGNKLLADCGAAVTILDGGGQSRDKSLGVGYCLGFLQGIGQMNDFYQLTQRGEPIFCRPSGVSNAQLARVVVKDLRDHPEQLHEKEFVLAVVALGAAFPCTNKK